MSKSMQFLLQVQANLGGNLQGQLKGIQGQMNALKSSAQFSSAFGNNLGAAMKYANNVADAAKIAAKMETSFNPNPKLLSELSKLQSQQAQIQEYKDALRNKQKLEQNFQKQVVKQSQAAAVKQAASQKVSNLKVQLEQFEAARAGLKRTSAEYKALAAQIKATKAEIKAANQELKSADSIFKSQRQATTAAGHNLSQQTSQLRQLQGALSSAGIGLNQLGAAETRLRSQIDSTTAALARQQEMAARRANFSNAVDNVGEKYSNFQNAVGTAESIMSPFVGAAQNAMTYEYELANVKALTQLKNIRAGNLDVVNEQVSAMDKTFRHLGATTEYTSSEVAQSAGYFAMAGWSAERIQAVMPAFINLATATRTSGAELARLADTFSDDMTAAGLIAGQNITYGKDKNGNALQMEASEYFTNAMAYAVTNANLNRESLHEGVKYFAPVAKNLGLDVAEMFATTMLTANAGIKGSQMGTAFRSGLIRLVAPTKGAASALAEMGMTMSDAQKQYLEAGSQLEAIGISANATFSEKLKGISEYLSTVDQNKKTDFINAVFGKNAFSAWAEIFSDPSKVAQIAEYTNTMRSGEMVGYAGDTANVMRDSTKIQWEYVKSGMDAVVNQVGTALLPAITAAAQALAPILVDVAEWISKNQELIVVLAGVAAAISTVIVAAAGIQLISAAWGMVTASATLASGAISSAATFLSGLSFSSLAGAASLINPVTAALAGLAAVIYAVYTHWEQVAPALSHLADTFSASVTPALNSVKAAFGSLGAAFGDMANIFSSSRLADGFAKEFVMLATIVAQVMTAIVNVVANGVTAIVELFSGLANAVKNIMDGEFRAAGAALMDGLKNSLHYGGKAIVKGFTDFGKIPSAVRNSLDVYEGNGGGGAGGSFAPVQQVQPVQSTIQQVQPVQSTIQQVQPVQTLDLTNIQSQIDNFGNAVSNQTYSFENFGTSLTSHSENINSTLGNVLSSANETVAQVASVNTAISESAAVNSEVQANLQNVNANISESAAAVTTNTAEVTTNATALTQNTAEITNLTSTVQTSVTAIQNLTTAAEMSVASIQNMATSADGSTGSISNLAAAADSAASSLGGLGSAVSSAINSIQVAGANAAAAIPTASVAHNAKGGIHTGGQFLSWINEKGPEAIIPLDGSSRAMQLWQAAGKILGVEPQNNFLGNIFNSSGNSIFSEKSKSSDLSSVKENSLLSTFHFPLNTIPTGTSWNPNLPNPLPQIQIPNFDIFSQIQNITAQIFQPIQDIFGTVTSQIQNVTSQIQNVTSQIFSPIQDIFGTVTSQIQNVTSQIQNITSQIFQPFQDIFSQIPLAPVIRTREEGLRNKEFSLNPYPLTPNIGGGIWEQILNPTPTFPTVGTFPTLETSTNSMNQQTLQPTFNFTFNITSNNAEDFKNQMPQIQQSFEEQFENYMSDWQRRSFAW